MRGRTRLVGQVGALLFALMAGSTLEGQEREEGREPPPPARDTVVPPGGIAPEDRPRRRGCPLVLEPEETTNLNRIQRDGAHVYHIGGGMLWRCGNAEMEADSAVRYEAAHRVEMMGNVDYRDTIRTLKSRFLTYYEFPDLVVATGDVHLTRLSTGSTLRGPRIEFLRAVSGREELTTATGRPHLTLHPTEGRENPPFEVDADLTILAGEEMARARGDVVIRRPDLLARADSAIFDIAEGGGVLYGSPEVEGRGFRLSGDTIRLRFREEELREVWARGRAFAAGESFEVAAEQVRASIEDEKAREVWAYGAGRSFAVSTPYRVYGDSLRFVLTAGRIDTVVAVGDAIAEEEGGDPGTASPPSPEAGTGADRPAARPDSAGVAARSDSAGVAARSDSVEVAGRSDSVAVIAHPDSVAPAGAAKAAGDTAAMRRVERSSPGSVPPPTLGLEGTTSWMEGDTLVAVFEPARADPEGAEEPADPSEEEPADPVAISEAAPPAPAAVGGPTGPAAADSAGRRLERIRVVSVAGTARAYYAAVMDSTRTSEPSRNYIVGREIELLFDDGAVSRVRGERAIGLHLDPRGETGEGRPGRMEGVGEAASAADSAAASGDTASVPDSAAVRDTTTARRGGVGRASRADGGSRAGSGGAVRASTLAGPPEPAERRQGKPGAAARKSRGAA